MTGTSVLTLGTATRGLAALTAATDARALHAGSLRSESVLLHRKLGELLEGFNRRTSDGELVLGTSKNL